MPTAFPRVANAPPPAYPATSTMLLRGLGRTVRETLLFALASQLLAPVYARCYGAFLLHDHPPPLFASSPYLAHVTRDDLFFTFGLSAAIGLTYLTYNGVFYYLDRFRPNSPYKMPRKAAQEPSDELIAATLLKEAIAHLVTGPLIMCFAAGPLLRWTGGGHARAVAPEALPDFFAAWRTFLVVFLTNECLFYSGHRLLHTPLLYAAIHKQHHSYRNTRSFAAEYAHVAEDVLTAYMPFLAGLVLTGAHYHVVFVWFMLRLTEVYEAHSGYCFRDAPAPLRLLSHWRSAVHHDHHHVVNMGNFGWELLDHLFGTMDHFVAAGGVECYLCGRRASGRAS